MSKEIYKDYFNDWIRAVDKKAQIKVNELYLWDGRSIVEHNKTSYCDSDCFLGLVVNNLTTFTRKPKTQMINGHEVVAPRYDKPNSGQPIYLYYPLYKEGVLHTSYTNYTDHTATTDFGWFDNAGDAIAYANAHRENKND